MRRSKKQTIEDVDKLLTIVFEEATPEVWATIPGWGVGFIDYPSYSEVIKCLIENYNYTENYLSQLIDDCRHYKLSAKDNPSWKDDEFSTPGDLVEAIKYNIIDSIDVNEGSDEYRREEYENYISDNDEDNEYDDEEVDDRTFKEQVLDFIKRFQNEGTIKTFTSGCCYWFAQILNERFNFAEPECGIFYNEKENHFATMIDLHLYDITGDLGDIRNLHDWTSWNDYQNTGDELIVKRLYRDCIDF